MLKVVIVDDEMIVRVGFQSCICWEDYGCQVTAACESAEDAIRFFQKEVPDIVFTDIMMPGMNGIELVEYVCRHYPKTKVVVLSCVNEIEYVKRAIKLGAEDYILKLSFTQDTMKALLEKLLHTIEEERRQDGSDDIYTEIQSFHREEGFRTLMLGNLKIPDREALLDRLGYGYDPFEKYFIGCFLIDHFKSVKGVRNGDLHMMQFGLQNIIREYFEKLPGFDLEFIQEDELMVLFRGSKDDSFLWKIPELVKPLNDTLKTHFNLTLSLGMNPEPYDRNGIPSGYRKAKELALLRFFDGNGTYHQEEGCVKESFITKRSVQKRIQEAIFKQDFSDAGRQMDVWFDEMKGYCCFAQIKNIRRSIVETWVFVSGYSLPEDMETEEYDELYTAVTFWEAETLEELKESFLNGIKTILNYLTVNKMVNPEIKRLLNYLDTHVEENISLECAANMCALGKSQFCILFKKTTGDTFINYFNRLKMKKAFELLGREKLQVQEVADRIGIRDISYFSRMFKKYYQMNPSDVKCGKSYDFEN